MFKLVRQVRFSVNPFLYEVEEGANSYCSRPSGEGLCLFFGLWVEVIGDPDPQTGFVVNVVEIDRAVRWHVAPIFRDRIRERYGKAEYILYGELAELLRMSRDVLEGRFGGGRVGSLTLQLNPGRAICLPAEDSVMVLFSEKFEFAAMHTLWNEEFTPEENDEVFGKCANPTGHGHNYVLEVTVALPAGDEQWSTGRFEHVVDREVIEAVDHKNLNVDVPVFRQQIPTVENLAKFAWDRLEGQLGEAELMKVTVWETDKTFCSYSGREDG